VLLGSLVLAVPVFLIAVLLGCIAFLCFIAEYSLWCALGTTLLIVLLTCFVNLNATALHRYYRDRLARTYLVSGGVRASDKSKPTMSGHSLPRLVRKRTARARYI
jgi:hypothetical protein